MLRRRRTIFSALLVPVFLPAIALAGIGACGSQAVKSNQMADSRLAVNEAKLTQLEERLAVMEEKTERLDGVSEGVALLLERLEAFGAEGQKPARRKPSSTAVYAMPIDGDPFIGPKHAKVTMVKGYDFYCGYCDKVRPVLAQLQSIYGKDLKIVFKNFVIHDDYARLPALAACAAHKQDKFMPMFEQIWIQGMRSRRELNEAHLLKIAGELKLNPKRFAADMHGSCEDKVQSDSQSMAALGSTGTPVFYINGRFLSGALPIDSYRRVIDQELAKANRAIKGGIKLKDYYQRAVLEDGRTSI